jgi:hypothetical protein
MLQFSSLSCMARHYLLQILRISVLSVRFGVWRIRSFSFEARHFSCATTRDKRSLLERGVFEVTPAGCLVFAARTMLSPGLAIGRSVPILNIPLLFHQTAGYRWRRIAVRLCARLSVLNPWPGPGAIDGL